MFQLKPLTKAGIPHALERAERYRLLNEPAQAESICLDIVLSEPNNQQALIMLLLSLTDQFREGHLISESRIHEVLGRIEGNYEQRYYAGIVFERRAKAKIDQNAPHAKFIAYEFCRKAMEQYEHAEKLRHSGNDDALLRWNACARMIMQHKLEEQEPDRMDTLLE